MKKVEKHIKLYDINQVNLFHKVKGIMQLKDTSKDVSSAQVIEILCNSYLEKNNIK